MDFHFLVMESHGKSMLKKRGHPVTLFDADVQNLTWWESGSYQGQMGLGLGSC